MQPLHVGDELELYIKKLGINGEGIGYYQNLAIFVDHAIPQEHVLVQITDIYHNRAEAKVLRILEASQHRQTPFCPVYEQCGGCQTQHIAEDQMAIFKRELIIQAFKRYISSPVLEHLVKETIRSPKTSHYRNKASLPVRKIDQKNAFGMYQRNSNQFIKIDHCPVQYEEINKIFQTAIMLLDHYRLDAYDQKRKKGFVVSIVCRYSIKEKQAQVTFHMKKQDQRLKRLSKALVDQHKEIISIYQVLTSDPKKTRFFEGEKTLIYGEPHMKETLNGHTFLLGPEAFFQLNSDQAHHFYQEMARLANLKKHEVAIDAYAGSSPVSHYIHDQCKKVYAIELNKESCLSAKASLALNNISNVIVLESDFFKALNSMKKMPIDVMFFDPPRTGLGHQTILSILKHKPKRIIYGSCNPSTLAKDLDLLLNDYDLIETVPLDMFPQTALVESVTLLHKKS